MATHDYVISNASGAAVRADLNNALAAIVSNNSNATEPSTTYSYMLWADNGSSPPVMKLRNAANDGWVTLFQLDGEWSTLAVEDGTAAAPSLYFKDSGTDTGFFSSGTDEVAISTGGTERMKIDSSGTTQIQTGGSNDDSLVFKVESPTNTEPVRMYVAASGTANASIATIRLQNVGVNSRSLNATGTVNASGTDYAEYMLKAGDFTIVKGDICGVTDEGMLTNIYSEAVSYLVKSTNPSYVGGDGIWGSTEQLGERPSDNEKSAAEWDLNFESERSKVDRIAFSGQVPVNVMGAIPGQYIIPIASEDGGITGIAKDEGDLTLAEYMRAVGKVIAIEDDGRARIIVKVA